MPSTTEGATASADIDNLCIGCTVENVGNVVSPFVLQSARVNLPVGVASSARIRVSLAEVSTGGRAVGAVLRDRTGLLDLEAFDRVTVRTLLNGVVQDEASMSTVLRASLLGSDKAAYTLRSSTSFDAIEIEVSSLLSALTDLDVLYTAVRLDPVNPIVVANEEDGATISTSTSTLCLGCGVDRPNAAIDDTFRSAAEYRVPLAVLGTLRSTIEYGRTLPGGSRTGLLLSTPVGLIDATVLGRTTLDAMMGDDVVASASGDDIIVQGSGPDRIFASLRVEVPFDAVRLTLSGVANIGLEVDAHAAISVLPAGASKNEYEASVAIDPLAADAFVSSLPTTGADLDAPAAISKAADTVRLGAAPNPFSSRTSIQIVQPAAGDISIAVFDLLGRKVTQLHNGPLDRGEHAFDLDADRWPAGVYVVRASSADGTSAVRVTRGR